MKTNLELNSRNSDYSEQLLNTELLWFFPNKLESTVLTVNNEDLGKEVRHAS